MLRVNRFLFALVLVAFAGTAAQADWVPGRRMEKAVDRITSKAKTIAKKQDLYFAEGTCIVAGFLDKDGSMSLTRPFIGGETYVLLGGGDDNAIDVDIEIYDKSDQKVAEDTETDASPVVTFKPKKSGDFRMKVILHDANKKTGSFCALTVLCTKGYDVPVDNLSKCLGTIITRAESIDKKAGGGVIFHSGPGQMALFGAVVPEGQDLSITGMTLSKGDYVAIGAGDTVSKDLDLAVLDSDAKVFKEDTESDTVPVVTFNAKSNGVKAGLRAKNVKSKGPSLCMFALLTIIENEK